MKRVIYVLTFCLLSLGIHAQQPGSEPLNFIFSPNPVRDWVHIEVSVPVTVEIMDIRGEVIIKTTISGHDDLNMTDLPQGIYFLKLFTADQVQTARLVKMKPATEI